MSTWLNQDSDKNLSDNEIHIWVNYLNAHEARLKHLYPLLSFTEKERSERFKFYKHRKAFIASHGFLHSVLSYYINTPANEIEFKHEEQGKPYIEPNQNNEHIQFNLSHSNNLAILAICKNHSIGIDIEFAQRKTDWAGLAKRFFTETEKEHFFNINKKDQKDAFFQVWTRKEAHMKVTGKGLHLAPTQFEVSVPPRPAQFIKHLNLDNSHQYIMQDITLPTMFSDYYACLSASFEFANIKQFVHT